MTYEDYRVRDRKLFDSFPERLTKLAKEWEFRTAGGLRVAEYPDGTGSQAQRLGKPSRERVAGSNANGAYTIRASGEPPGWHAIFRSLRSLDSVGPASLCRLLQRRDPRLSSRNHLRSKNHPAPELARRGDSLEAPVLGVGAGLVQARANVLPTGNCEVLAGNAPLGQLPTRTVRGCRGLEDSAREHSTLTLFVRLCLADGFIHGIGGGTYDQVTDDIIRRYYGIEPPGYTVVSATATGCR